MIVLGIGAAVAMYMSTKKEAPKPEQQASAAVVVSSQASSQASAPLAASKPAATSGQATTSVALEAPASTQPAVYWFEDAAESTQKHYIGSLDPKGDFLAQLELVNQGASVNTLKLSRYFVNAAEKRISEKDPAAFEAKLAADPAKYHGHYSLLNPVSYEGRTFLPLATRRIRVNLPGQEPVAFSLDKIYWRLDANQPAGQDANVQSARYVYTLMRGTDLSDALKNPVLRLAKTYALRKGDYSLSVSLQVENLSSQTVTVGVEQYGPVGVPMDDPYEDKRQAAYAKLRLQDSSVMTSLMAKADLDKQDASKPHEIGRSNGADPLLWIGEVNKFFGSMMYLVPSDANQLCVPELGAAFLVDPIQETATSKTFLPQVDVPVLTLGPKGTAASARNPALTTITFDLFAGPKVRAMFEDAQAKYYKPQYKQLKFIDTIDLKSCCWFTAPISLGVMWLLEFFAKYLSFDNYGVSIILLVLLVRLALHPLTKKGQVSMSKMQKLGPKLAKLKEKYADDKATLQKETMKLYKENGASPVIGCLPMFLQMPIWMALWVGVSADIHLRHAAFLPFWLTDLASPDALISWSANLPLLGHSFNLLPLLLTVAMYLQTATAPQMTQATTPEQEQQQKMMKYMMPVMMLFIFYKMPMGLTLYVMASTFAGVIEQYVIRKHIKEREAMAELVETTIDMPGKASRNARGKKAKGPTWFKRG